MSSDDYQAGGQQAEPNQSQLKMKKLQWQCRRGMLELDVILIPFLDQHFSALEQKSQLLFEELLTIKRIFFVIWGFSQLFSSFCDQLYNIMYLNFKVNLVYNIIAD